MSRKIDVIAVVGPTASGKTALSIELAKRLDGEIINGDSTQVYEGMDIGTAKITSEEMEGIPHHMFDIKNPDESFSVAEYQSEVRNWIRAIKSRGKMPIIVGGTGLYIQSVLFDFRFTEEASDDKIRTRLEQELQNQGAKCLYERLVKLDPIGAKKIHPNNHRRIVRALEIIEVTGKTKSDQEENAGKKALYEHLLVGLDMDRELLYERIDKRVEVMMAQGFLKEVQTLLRNGIRDTQSMGAIGYRELQQHIESDLPLDEAIRHIQKRSRNYAKRQMTYFRNKVDITWYNAEEETVLIADQIVQKLKCFDEQK